MKRLLRATFGLGALVLGLAVCAPALSQQGPSPFPPGVLPPGVTFGGMGGGEGSKFQDFDRLVKGGKEHDGLFKLHHKDDNVYAEIRQDQFERPFLLPIAIARGAGMGGLTLNFDEQWVILFRRVGDKVHLVRRNIHFKAKSGSPVGHAVQTTYTDSVLLALRIQALNAMRNSVVINLNDIFMTDFAQLNLGGFDSSRSSWSKVRAFQKNLELQVSATFSGRGGRGMMFGGSDAVIDPRGQTLVIHYSLVDLPSSGYQPRMADDRVGYFLTAVKDFSRDDKDTSFVRYINRWNLERSDGSSWKEGGKLVPPKKKIVYWIEKSVPDEYRAYVRQGILEWNKAFEKIGFRDAIEVRQQEEDTTGEFDPEDVRFSTFRWITTDEGFAMGPSRANPLTGEIIDADIIFDASMVQYYKQQQKLLSGQTLGVLEHPSPILAARQGIDLLHHPFLDNGNPLSWNRGKQPNEEEVERLRLRLGALRQGVCQCAAHRGAELGLAAMTLASVSQTKPGEKLPDELIGQAIKEVTMHEVGHTLGLRHNFKASTMLRNDQLHDTALTRKQGLVGSVMDYAPINLAPKGVKQGDYFTTTIGPYDYWAIEYAYRPLSGGTEGEYEELKKIASRCASPGFDYATDEDMMTPDPLVNVWDLGSDPMQFGKDRMLLAQELLNGLADRVVDNGEGYQRLRLAFQLLLRQYGDAAALVSQYVGGEYVHRDHKGDPNGRDPFVPVTSAKQKEALKFLQDNLLTDKPFQFSPQLLRRLGADRWSHWGNDEVVMRGVEFPVYQRILAIQRMILRQLLDSGTLARIQTNALKADKEDPLQLADVFRCLTDGIWNDVGAAPVKGNSSGLTIRRNLQREHLKSLTGMVLGGRGRDTDMILMMLGGSSSNPLPPDARSLARLHLRQINRKIEGVLMEKAASIDDTSRAHLEECQERISKVLTASVQVNDP